MSPPERPEWLWSSNSYLPLGLPLGEQVRAYIEHLEAELAHAEETASDFEQKLDFAIREATHLEARIEELEGEKNEPLPWGDLD